VVNFTDVDLYNPFYVYIRCLACRGIISGYSDGTFRPYNNVTRGQAAKMVVSAAGFTDPIASTQQTFTDVPPSSPFWLWVERAALRGVINGYNTAADCPSGIPCFQPFNPLTRGQLAKIVAQAAGFNDDPGTAEDFADVPVGSVFWVYIERLSRRGIIAGYDCGSNYVNPCTGQLETCDAGSRPYFRWCAYVTRGQASKIMANTFFPVNCAPGPYGINP
jgi:hypothetical protein